VGLAVDLNRLEIFKEVVQAGSFTRAAAKLRQPKSRISRQVAALERELGTQLIYRTTRQFQLTPAGRELFQRAAPLLGGLFDTLEQLSAGAEAIAGPLRVTLPEDVGVELAGAWLREFQALHPGVRLEIDASNRMIDLVRDGYDLALRIGKLADSSLLQRRVGAVSLGFVASPALAGRRRRELEDLDDLPYLAFAPAATEGQPLTLRNGRQTRTLRLRPALAANNFFVLRELARHGAGLALLPEFVVRRAVEAGELVALCPDWRPPATPLQIVTPRQLVQPARVRAFADFLADKVAAQF
jgi:DNA-binding transcriptional LysR family regulator